MSESNEKPPYLSSLTIERTKENVEFVFDPPVPTEELSEKIFDYLENDVVDHEGDAVIETVNEKHCLTKIVIPKTFPRKIVLTMFKEFENGNICAAVTEADLSESRKKEQPKEVSSSRTRTSKAVEETLESERPKPQESRERREGPRFSVKVRIAYAEERNNDLRLTVDAYLYIGNRRNNRDYERVEPVIFEYNGVRKELSTSRIGKIRNKVLYFRDAFKRGEKLRIWPKAHPDNVIELDIYPREEKTLQPQGPRPLTSAATRKVEAEKQSEEPQTPEEDGLSKEIGEVRKMTEKLSGEVGRLLRKIDEQNAALKDAAVREEELKKKVEELDEKKRIAEDKKAKIAKAKADVEDKARKEAEEKARKEQEEKERREQELKRIGNAAADYLEYADIADLLSPQEKNRIEQKVKTLREGKVEGSTKKYTETLLRMRDKYTPDKVDQASTDIWVVLKNLMQDIDLPMSAFTVSKSWVLWDMAKQTYLAEHPDESTPDYKLGNPMEDAEICQQISDRHFGWEMYWKYKTSADAKRKIDGILINSPRAREAQQFFAKVPTSKGTMRSIELQELGKIVRTAMEMKHKAEQNEMELKRETERNQRDLEDALRNGTEMKTELAKALLSSPGKLEIKRGLSLVLPKETFIVQADIFVEPGAKLNIPAGAKLFFNEGGGVVCRGMINARGTEAEPVIFAGKEKDKLWKNITIEGPEASVLEYCEIHGGGGRVYSFDQRNHTATVDETGKNPQKNEKSGGGLACMNGCNGTTIANVKVVGCQVEGEGGGIWNYESSPIFNSVYCLGNKARYGGGIYIIGGNPNMEKVVFAKNIAKLKGGGLCIAKGSPRIKDCDFQYNSSENGGGLAISTDHGTHPVFGENRFYKNSASKFGGGIFLYLNYHGAETGYYPSFEGRIELRENHAKEGGGSYVYHEITRHNYEEHEHAFSLGDVIDSDNTPDSHRVKFRLVSPSGGHGHH